MFGTYSYSLNRKALHIGSMVRLLKFYLIVLCNVSNCSHKLNTLH